MRGIPILAAISALVLLTGCGSEAAGDNAVEAREQNTVELGGVSYRVVLFRQLNVNGPPDEALWESSPPRAGRGLYVVVVRACAAGAEPAQMSERLHLEDAFGERFPPTPGRHRRRLRVHAGRARARRMHARAGKRRRPHVRRSSARIRRAVRVDGGAPDDPRDSRPDRSRRGADPARPLTGAHSRW